MTELPPLFVRRYSEPGAAPGAFAEGERPSEQRIRVVQYDERSSSEWDADPRSVLEVECKPEGVVWIDVQGLGDGTLARALEERFGLHRLAVADAFNLGQRPKADEYDESTYVVLRAAHLRDDGESIVWEQVSVFLLEGLVITVQEHPDDCLDPLRHRIRASRSTLRQLGADYLAAMLVDTVVDGYFPVLEALGERLEVIESEVLERPGVDVLRHLYRTKRDLLVFRRAAWPLREALVSIMRSPGPHFSAEINPFLRDTTDHVVQVVDLLESYRELSASLIDVHVSMLGQRTNTTMRLLTGISTIFIPLTFLAGVYGMNFDTSLPGNLPELAVPYGYTIFWVVCIAVAVVLVLAFRRLGWLRSRD